MIIRLASEVKPSDWPEGKGSGWKKGRHRSVVLENPDKRVNQQVLHVVICNDDGVPMWDQFLHWENGGAITLPVNSKGQIGLIEIERPVQRENRPFQLVGRSKDVDAQVLVNLGRKCLEAPRGMASKNEKPGETAAREAEEELGRVILAKQYVGCLIANSTFDPRLLHGYIVQVNEKRKSSLPKDVNEKIFKVDWYDPLEVAQMLQMGPECPIVCSFTKAQLAHFFAARWLEQLEG